VPRHQAAAIIQALRGLDQRVKAPGLERCTELAQGAAEQARQSGRPGRKPKAQCPANRRPRSARAATGESGPSWAASGSSGGARGLVTRIHAGPKVGTTVAGKGLDEDRSAV